MQILRTIAEVRAALGTASGLPMQPTLSPKSGTALRPLGLAPTMGALHQGHLSLVREARLRCATVVASIFVNPLQFGPQEDLSRYPRPFEHDCDLLQAEGVDFLFAPMPEEMYPAGATTFVEVPGISDQLEGAVRPGHFRGVATVVSKLFHIVQPDAAFFGQKDAQQSAVLRRMTRDLNLPVEIVICPIIREPDGLAMSSRNIYLGAHPEHRERALTLHRALQRIAEQVRRGERNPQELIRSGLAEFAKQPEVKLDYLAIVDADSFADILDFSPSQTAVVVVAARVGDTRLLDNMVL